MLRNYFKNFEIFLAAIASLLIFVEAELSKLNVWFPYCQDL